MYRKIFLSKLLKYSKNIEKIFKICYYYFNFKGQRRENISNLKEVYDVDLIVKADDKVKQGKSKIKITKFYGDFSK